MVSSQHTHARTHARTTASHITWSPRNTSTHAPLLATSHGLLAAHAQDAGYLQETQLQGLVHPPPCDLHDKLGALVLIAHILAQFCFGQEEVLICKGWSLPT